MEPIIAVEPSPPPARIGNRLQNLWLVDRLKRFGHTLKSNAVWMKQFLHGRE